MVKDTIREFPFMDKKRWEWSDLPSCMKKTNKTLKKNIKKPGSHGMVHQATKTSDS